MVVEAGRICHPLLLLLLVELCADFAVPQSHALSAASEVASNPCCCPTPHIATYTIRRGTNIDRPKKTTSSKGIDCILLFSSPHLSKREKKIGAISCHDYKCKVGHTSYNGKWHYSS